MGDLQNKTYESFHKIGSSASEATNPIGSKDRKRPGEPRGKLGENIAQYNFKKIAWLGLGIRNARMLNETAGKFTGNRFAQRQNENAMLGFQYGVGIAKFGVFGAVYAGADFGYRAINYGIDVNLSNLKAEDNRRLAGSVSHKANRYGGAKL